MMLGKQRSHSVAGDYVGFHRKRRATYRQRVGTRRILAIAGDRGEQLAQEASGEDGADGGARLAVVHKEAECWKAVCVDRNASRRAA